MMRLIDADALIKEMDKIWFANRGNCLDVYANIDEAPTIEAEPVRHEGNTTFMTTSDIDAYKSRIIIGESKNKFCRVFYEDDREHGRWIHDYNNLYGCSECMERETMPHRKLKHYCPNCGAKMDLEENA